MANGEVGMELLEIRGTNRISVTPESTSGDSELVSTWWKQNKNVFPWFWRLVLFMLNSQLVVEASQGVPGQTDVGSLSGIHPVSHIFREQVEIESVFRTGRCCCCLQCRRGILDTKVDIALTSRTRRRLVMTVFLVGVHLSLWTFNQSVCSSDTTSRLILERVSGVNRLGIINLLGEINASRTSGLLVGMTNRTVNQVWRQTSGRLT